MDRKHKLLNWGRGNNTKEQIGPSRESDELEIFWGRPANSRLHPTVVMRACGPNVAKSPELSRDPGNVDFYVKYSNFLMRYQI